LCVATWDDDKSQFSYDGVTFDNTTITAELYDYEWMGSPRLIYPKKTQPSVVLKHLFFPEGNNDFSRTGELERGHSFFIANDGKEACEIKVHVRFRFDTEEEEHAREEKRTAALVEKEEKRQKKKRGIFGTLGSGISTFAQGSASFVGFDAKDGALKDQLGAVQYVAYELRVHLYQANNLLAFDSNGIS
jgi:hypothetical protein